MNSRREAVDAPSELVQEIRRGESSRSLLLFDPEELFYKGTGNPSVRARLLRIKNILKGDLDDIDSVLACITLMVRGVLTRNIDPAIANTINGMCNTALTAIKLKGQRSSAGSLIVKFGRKAEDGTQEQTHIEATGPAAVKELAKIVDDLKPTDEPLVVIDDDDPL